MSSSSPTPFLLADPSVTLTLSFTLSAHLAGQEINMSAVLEGSLYLDCVLSDSNVYNVKNVPVVVRGGLTRGM